MDGIVVIASHAQEWMLPWWWMHYHFHNSLPVAFIDLGLSEAARRWCARRGEVIPLKEGQKPNAMLLSPFENSLLIDLDAQVCAPLDPLFELPRHPSGIFLSENRTAAILFEQGAPLIQEWAAEGENEAFLTQCSVGTLPKNTLCVSTEPHSANAAIVHWIGPDKKAIRGAIALCENLLMNLSFEES